jgi:hypothetical protein
MTRVAGRCPGCGNETLFLGDGAHVTCSWLKCTAPCAAADMLEKRHREYGKFEMLGVEIGAKTDEKQAAYGDSFGKSGNVLREFYPEGVRPDQFDDMLAIVRIVDKLFRIATNKDALGESPYRDITGYGLLGAERTERIRNCEHRCWCDTGEARGSTFAPCKELMHGSPRRCVKCGVAL